MSTSLNTWVEINQKDFTHNIHQLKMVIGPGILFSPVIKSNAYGHDLLQIAQLCEVNTNVDWIGVVSLSEAVCLRKNYITKPILVLSIWDEDITYALLYNIDVVICDYFYAHHINSIARTLHKKAYVHIKIDTGLSRLGILAEHAQKVIEKIAQLSHIIIRGIFTHFSDSEQHDNSFAHKQIHIFNKLLESIKTISIPYKHISCSAAVLTIPHAHFNFCRAGISIYGLWPSHETKQKTKKMYPQFELKPILQWKTRIIQIKIIPKNQYVGYDRTYKTDQRTKIGILPIGYYDGYDRKLSNCAKVYLKGKLAPIIGRVAMNLTIIDLTDIPNPQLHEEVTLLGPFRELTATDIAHKIGTINYEVVTRIHPAIPRLLV